MDSAFFFRCALAVLPLAVSLSAQGSAYPPNYVVESECQSQGPVTVCTYNRHWGRLPRIYVTYTGDLLNTQWGRISAFVRLNGKEGIYPLQNANYSESAVLGDLQNVTRCKAANVPGPYPICRTPEALSSGWDFDPAPQNEVELFAFARNEFGIANAWDIQVAFVGQNGVWDSQNGKNYRFRFE